MQGVLLLLLCFLHCNLYHLRVSNLRAPFSAAKAALDMQMSVSQSVCQSVINSVCLSVTLIFLSDLLVYFIIANRTEMKLKQSLNNPRQNYDN